MIRIEGALWYRRDPRGWGGCWRYGANTATITCDAPGCVASATPKGLEHNGAEVECIYLKPEDQGWALGCGEDGHDFCPVHAPPDEPESDGDER